VALGLLFCLFDLLLGLLLILLLLACQLLLSSHALNRLVWLGWRHLHNTCASVKYHSFPVMHDTSCMMHHESNSLDKKICCQQRKHHEQAQAQTALSAISDNREFSNIPARRGTMGDFARAPLLCVLARPKRGVRAQLLSSQSSPLFWSLLFTVLYRYNRAPYKHLHSLTDEPPPLLPSLTHCSVKTIPEVLPTCTVLSQSLQLMHLQCFELSHITAHHITIDITFYFS
jgi:hypothetical protein